MDNHTGGISRRQGNHTDAHDKQRQARLFGRQRQRDQSNVERGVHHVEDSCPPRGVVGVPQIGVNQQLQLVVLVIRVVVVGSVAVWVVSVDVGVEFRGAPEQRHYYRKCLSVFIVMICLESRTRVKKKERVKISKEPGPASVRDVSESMFSTQSTYTHEMNHLVIAMATNPFLWKEMTPPIPDLSQSIHTEHTADTEQFHTHTHTHTHTNTNTAHTQETHILPIGGDVSNFNINTNGSDKPVHL
jgi:hypothetical protein